METYIKQLIADLETAKKMKVPPFKCDDSSEHPKTSMERFSRVEKICFPPVEKLSHKQIQDLVNAIIALLKENKYIVNVPARLPIELTYQKMLEKWTDEIYYVDSGLHGLDFCPENLDDCDLHKWCDWCFEVGVDTIPVYNGIYDDDGNKINVLDIPVPDLCLSCENFLDNDWDENLLCNLSRAEKREEGEEFVCYAWRERESL